jgi:parallel beta-helix repeat protein
MGIFRKGEKMKTTKLLASIVAVMGVLALSWVGNAGNLEPTAPPGSTMKTLDEVQPGTPISSVPYIISSSGHYYLSAEAQTTSSLFSGITIWASNVTLDLKGFALIGDGTAGRHGIVVEGEYKNIKVCNGTVRNWGGNGVDIAGADNSQLANLRIYENTGIGLSAGQGSTIENCTVYDNGIIGISANAGTVTNCTAYSNTGIGILADNGSTVLNCVARSNGSDGIGLSTGGGTATGCTARHNGGSGISGAVGCIIRDCTAEFNTANGISVADGASVKGCTARSNVNYGIDAGQACMLTANIAYDNNDTGIQTDNSCTVTANNSSYNDGAGACGISAGDSCRLTNNTACYNNTHGIYFANYCTVISNTCDNNRNEGEGAGLRSTGEHSRIEANNVTNNDRGIYSSEGPNVIVKNTAGGNNVPYILHIFDKHGTQSTDPAIAGPWDNFDF